MSGDFFFFFFFLILRGSVYFIPAIFKFFFFLWFFFFFFFFFHFYIFIFNCKFIFTSKRTFDSSRLMTLSPFFYFSFNAQKVKIVTKKQIHVKLSFIYQKIKILRKYWNFVFSPIPKNDNSKITEVLQKRQNTDIC